jgi:hypothetical protein
VNQSHAPAEKIAGESVMRELMNILLINWNRNNHVFAYRVSRFGIVFPSTFESVCSATILSRSVIHLYLTEKPWFLKTESDLSLKFVRIEEDCDNALSVKQ